jgi:hypothetical protein
MQSLFNVKAYCDDLRVCDYRRGMDWWMDLLNTYTHHSELELQRHH